MRPGGGVRVLRTRRKHHKSKDWNFLHRNYIQFFFSTPPKNIFSSMIKNVFRKFSGIFGFSKGFLINPLWIIRGYKVCSRINSPPNTFFSPKIRVFGVWRWFWAFWIAMGIGYHVLLTEIKNCHFLFFSELKN